MRIEDGATGCACACRARAAYALFPLPLGWWFASCALGWMCFTHLLWAADGCDYLFQGGRL